MVSLELQTVGCAGTGPEQSASVCTERFNLCLKHVVAEEISMCDCMLSTFTAVCKSKERSGEWLSFKS